jgi:hypothetical protein
MPNLFQKLHDIIRITIGWPTKGNSIEKCWPVERYKVCFLRTRTTPKKKKTVTVRTFSIFNFYQYGCQPSLRTSRNAFITARALRQIPLRLLLGGLLGEGEACQFTLHPQPTHQHWERCLRWPGNSGVYRYKRRRSWVAPSSSHSKPFWSFTWLTF